MAKLITAARQTKKEKEPALKGTLASVFLLGFFVSFFLGQRLRFYFCTACKRQRRESVCTSISMKKFGLRLASAV